MSAHLTIGIPCHLCGSTHGTGPLCPMHEALLPRWLRDQMSVTVSDHDAAADRLAAYFSAVESLIHFARQNGAN